MIIRESLSEPYRHVCPRKRQLTLKWLAMELSFVKKQSVSRFCQEAIINCNSIDSQWAGIQNTYNVYSFRLEV